VTEPGLLHRPAADVRLKDLIIKEECAYFLEQTQLDVTRPDSKH
jgi:hypothetical protein